MIRHIDTPCGKKISVVTNHSGVRSYIFSDGTVWNPSKIHRVELQIAILDNDKEKYNSKDGKP